MNELQECGFTHLQYGVNSLWKVQNGEAIIFSTVFDNVILQIGFPVKKWQGGIEDQQEGGLSVHRPFLLLLCEVGLFKKKLVNASSRYFYLSPHLHGGIQWKDSIFRVLDDNTRHFNVCWAGLYGVWRVWIWILWTIFFLAFTILCNGLMF